MNVSALRMAAVALVVTATGLPSLASATPVVPTPLESTFTPVPPCRIYKSTVANSNAPLPANNYATVTVAGSGNFSSQGGPNGGCGVPASATAVAVSVTTSHATSTGTLNAFIPGNSSSTPGTAITFSPSLSQTTGLAIGLSSGAFQVEPVGGSTNVTVDVTGYYAPQIEAYINSGGQICCGTARIVSATHTSTGVYDITVDRDVSVCSIVAVANDQFYSASATSGVNALTDITVYTFALSNGAFVAVDEGFNLAAHC